MPIKQYSSTASWVLFLMGLFSQTQIRLIGFMDISEAFAYVAGPIFFILDLQRLRRDGFGSFLLVWFLCIVGAFVSSWVNHTPFQLMARGVATPISVFCLACVFYHFLSMDLKAVKWFFLGFALSMILCVFVFQRGADIGRGGGLESGEVSAEAVASYALFWLALWGTWITMPVYSFYLKLPRWYPLACALWFMIYGFFSAGSRSSLAVMLITVLLLIIGDKKRKSMANVKKHIVAIVIVIAIGAPLVGQFYKYCAINNYLGDAAYEKYMGQTKRGDSIWVLLMSGRPGFFAGLRAAVDEPILGHGPWAIDEKGYWREYVYKYGDSNDLKELDSAEAKGRRARIPGHSWVVTFWNAYGILGLVCMLYVGWLMLLTLKNRMAVIPELFGYFAFTLPSTIWAWFFSGFSSRTSTTLLFVLCVFAKSIEKGRVRFVSDADVLPDYSKR